MLFIFQVDSCPDSVFIEQPTTVGSNNMLNNPDNLENMVDDDVTVTNDEASFANLAGESLTSLVEIVPFTRDQVRKYDTI